MKDLQMLSTQFVGHTIPICMVCYHGNHYCVTMGTIAVWHGNHYCVTW